MANHPPHAQPREGGVRLWLAAGGGYVWRCRADAAAIVPRSRCCTVCAGVDGGGMLCAETLAGVVLHFADALCSALQSPWWRR